MNQLPAKPEFKETAEALARVISISKKSETSAIDASLFENPQEEELFKAYEACRRQIETLYQAKDYEGAFSELSKLKEPIEAYFDHTMVHAEDERLKANRLAQMASLAELIRSFANINAIIVK